MIRTNQNIIILIDVNDPKKAKSYSSLAKLCKLNPEFPLYELYKRDKYPFPFTKKINGVEYLFIRSQINSPANNLRLTNDIIKNFGFAKISDGEFRFINIYIKKSKRKYLFIVKSLDGSITNTKFITYVNELKELFEAEKGIKLDYNY